MEPISGGHRYGSGYTLKKADDTDSYIWPGVIQQLAALPKGSFILDAGCGNGHFTNKLHELGYDVVGVDMDASGIACSRIAFPGIRFEVASVNDDMGQLFGRPFDAVVSIEVIEHVYDPRSFATRIHAGLRPGGMFIISTPYHGYIKNLLIALSAGFDKHVDPLWEGGHIKFWSRATLTKLLEDSGFHVKCFLGAGRFSYLWKSMILIASKE